MHILLHFALMILLSACAVGQTTERVIPPHDPCGFKIHPVIDSCEDKPSFSEPDDHDGEDYDHWHNIEDHPGGPRDDGLLGHRHSPDPGLHKRGEEDALGSK